MEPANEEGETRLGPPSSGSAEGDHEEDRPDHCAEFLQFSKISIFSGGSPAIPERVECGGDPPVVERVLNETGQRVTASSGDPCAPG